MKLKVFLPACVILYLSVFNIASSQTNGVGYSSYFKKNIERGRAEEEALLDAQKNALIAYGGYINFSSTSLTSQNNSSDGKNSSANFDSKYRSTMKQLMQGMVKSIDQPHYEVRSDGKKKYIIARCTFSVDLMNIGDMISLYVKHTGNKIHVDFRVRGCSAIQKYLREYLTLDKAVFLFPPDGKDFVQGDFMIEIFNDHIDLHDKKTGSDAQNNNDHTGLVFKTFTFDNCSSALENKSSDDGIFHKTEAELFKVFLSKISDDIF